MKTNIDTELFLPNEAAKAALCSAATVKRLADVLRLEQIKTKGGVHLFTTEQVELIKAERHRRAKAN